MDFHVCSYEYLDDWVHSIPSHEEVCETGWWNSWTDGPVESWKSKVHWNVIEACYWTWDSWIGIILEWWSSHLKSQAMKRFMRLVHKLHSQQGQVTQWSRYSHDPPPRNAVWSNWQVYVGCTCIVHDGGMHSCAIQSLDFTRLGHTQGKTCTSGKTRHFIYSVYQGNVLRICTMASIHENLTR